MKFELNDRVAKLLQSEPFFAALSRNLPKRQDNSIPTAAISVDIESGRYEMIYNNDFFAGLPEDQQRGVLKHEFYHLVFGHVFARRPEDVSAQGQKLWNVATDLAINGHLKGELPEFALMPGEGAFEDLPAGESAEWYMAKLFKPSGEGEEGQQGKQDGEGSEPGQPGKPGEGAGNGEGGQGNQPDKEQFDDHDGWGEASSEATQMAKQRLKEDLKRAVQETASEGKGWGSVSSSVQKEIIKGLETHVNWKSILRYFIKTSQRSHRSSSIKRINKRYSYIHPGKRVNRTAKIAIAIDQSGSVNDDMLSAFFGELNKLAKLATFIVVPFDTEVKESEVYEWKKGLSRKTERVMCGGTCFEAPTTWANKNNVDGLIILTDMEAGKPKRCKSQRMWMTTKACAARPYFQTNERVIPIDI